MSADKPKPRDGVWTSDGLVADFRFIRHHNSVPELIYVETATGYHFVSESQLDWDVGREDAEIKETKA